mmetsp:Transcript_1827/g.2748  ORF Transcript_1827/g.2748 Transcript_1827/m.2748 type:complete len:373 (-) Transcript_1827:377-1495(-)
MLSEAKIRTNTSTECKTSMDLDACAARDVILTVFMEGTANRIDRSLTQVSVFSEASIYKSTRLPSERNKVDLALTSKGPGQYTLRFHGCGFSHGMSGTLFANGLKEQCSVIHDYVEEFINVKSKNRTGYKVTINFVGQSRGAIGGLYLAKRLKNYHVDDLVLNLFLVDPVPGNFVWISRYLDVLRVSNTNQVMDISKVRNLGRVVLLYPHEPLPDIAVHAPLLVVCPDNCELERDVVLGCHQGAIFLSKSTATRMSFYRIKEFLHRCGSYLDFGCIDYCNHLDISAEKLLQSLRRELEKKKASTTRTCHSHPPGAMIIRRETAVFVNRFHERLEGELETGRGLHIRDGNSGYERYLLDFAESRANQSSFRFS